MMLTKITQGPYAHSFEGYSPGRGFEVTGVRVEESSDKSGPWVIYAQGTLVPDVDPQEPTDRDFVAPGATLAAGWNRVVFIDGNANQQPTRPIYVGAAWKPGTKDVARILRARLFAQGGRILDFLNEENENGPTDPTRDEVLELIDDAASDIQSKIGLVLAPGAGTIAQHVTAVGAALLIEVGSEGFDQERYDRLKTLYDERHAQLLDAAQDEATGGEVGDGDDRMQAAGSFGPAGGTNVEGSEHSWAVIGKTGIEDIYSC